MDTEKIVQENLKLFGLDEEIKPMTMKHLMKITNVLDTAIQSKTEAIQNIKTNKISINKVAKDAGIARQTFYNNPIITAYIEKYIELNSIDSPYETIEALRRELRRKGEQINGLVQRDATVSKYKAQNKALTDEITSLQETIKSQEELIQKLKASQKAIKLYN